MSLIPLLAKQIKVDSIFLNNLNLNLGLNNDGSFEIEKYFPDQLTEDKNVENEKSEMAKLPYGLKLSNHLPDIRIGEYKVSFIDLSNGRNYLIKGNKTEIKDFVINKGLKVNAEGSMILAGREQFKYNLKIPAATNK